MESADQTAADVLGTALEGGIGYWSLATDIVYDDTSEDAVYIGVTLHTIPEGDVLDGDEDLYIRQDTMWGANYYNAEGYTITLADVKKAIQRCAFAKDDEVEYLGRTTRRACRDLLFEPEDADYDADVADEIIQVACFGKVVYG